MGTSNKKLPTIGFKFGSPDWKLINELRTNIYQFSVVTTYQQARELTDALYNKDGHLLSLPEFKKAALTIFDKYNIIIDLSIFNKYNIIINDEEYMYREQGGVFENLGTEYYTAISQAQNASKWADFVANQQQFPYLTYHTSGSPNVCVICEPLNGITLPIDDPFWDEFYPDNHFNCHCFVTQEDKYISPNDISTADEVKEAIKKVKEKIKPNFLMNGGKHGYVFSLVYPHFRVVPKDEILKKHLV